MSLIIFDYIPFGINVSTKENPCLGTIEHNDDGFWFEDESFNISSPVFKTEDACKTFVEVKLNNTPFKEL